MAATDDKYEHIYQHGGIVTVLKSHGLSAAQQHSQLCPSAPSSRATLAEKAAIVAKTKRDADAAAATTKAVAAVINTDAAAAVTIAAALVSAARATARGAAAREVATARRPAAKRAAAKAAKAAAAKPTEAAAAVPTAPTAEAVVPAAPLTPSKNSSSGVGSSGAPSAEPDSLRLRRLNMSSGDGSEGAPSAEPSAAPLEMSAFVSRKLVVRACSFERKVGQQRRGDDSGMLRRTLSFDKVQRGADKLQRRASFGRKNSRSSGRGEGGQTGALRLEPPPEGSISHEGFLWKRAAFKFQRRWFFIKSGTLCYYDPARPGETAHAIVCGQISSVTIKSMENLEFSLWTDQRQYDFRCDERQELTVWKEACEKAIAKHWYA